MILLTLYFSAFSYASDDLLRKQLFTAKGIFRFYPGSEDRNVPLSEGPDCSRLKLGCYIIYNAIRVN